MNLKTLICTAVLGCSLSFSSVADINNSASAELSALLDKFSTFSADFDQISASDDSRRMEQARGSLLLAKPNKFNWQALEPFPQQLVSDGETLWIYDPDLEQATRRQVEESGSGVPALILNGQIDQLQQKYKIRLLQEKDGNSLFELLPLDDSEVFTRIRLLFTDAVIAELQMEDSLGQRTSILFENQKLNPLIEPGMFAFSPPEGTDVIIEDGGELAN
ncbi:outer membrane lipoprotein chaperone LolA [Amphritea balenae]|uniref:Outer-membrane lipoprotein carrier protein n=1 Tax=Amphritea balenae TaxID=452629 RepID=A0A3P1SLX5_9GAMM|nr:outer membrane lipoprotein chaperone LolA [Amphritea balenae]RRC97914.1 outer membrane lipoprotein carrier protein LolA [Amphritea balenae]GGK81717.1 outer-membrane lipoprotein carrier protein [Amphritea balenae]